MSGSAFVIGFVGCVALLVAIVFIRAWLQGWRAWRNAEAAARGYENDDLV